MYEYVARVERVIDGDTLLVLIDCGFHIFTRVRLRLANVFADEITTTSGQRAQSFLRRLVEGKDVIVTTRRDRNDKYGRYLAVVSCGGKDVNAAMRLKFGHRRSAKR